MDGIAGLGGLTAPGSDRPNKIAEQKPGTKDMQELRSLHALDLSFHNIIQ